MPKSIPVAEIQAIVDSAVGGVLHRQFAARAFDRDELVNEAWRIALETLPNQQRAGAPMGPYLGFAIKHSLRKAVGRWTGRLPLKRIDTDDLERAADLGPSAEEMMLARAAAQRVIGSLSDLDRGIVSELLGSGGRCAADVGTVARTFGIPVTRVYQARDMITRRSRETTRVAARGAA